MIKRYRVYYTWHSGECFGAMMGNYHDYDIDEDNMEAWKRDFEEDDMDGSYCSINRMELLSEECESDV